MKSFLLAVVALATVGFATDTQAQLFRRNIGAPGGVIDQIRDALPRPLIRPQGNADNNNSRSGTGILRPATPQERSTHQPGVSPAYGQLSPNQSVLAHPGASDTNPAPRSNRYSTYRPAQPVIYFDSRTGRYYQMAQPTANEQPPSTIQPNLNTPNASVDQAPAPTAVVPIQPNEPAPETEPALTAPEPSISEDSVSTPPQKPNSFSVLEPEKN